MNKYLKGAFIGALALSMLVGCSNNEEDKKKEENAQQEVVEKTPDFSELISKTDEKMAQIKNYYIKGNVTYINGTAENEMGIEGTVFRNGNIIESDMTTSSLDENNKPVHVRQLNANGYSYLYEQTENAWIKRQLSNQENSNVTPISSLSVLNDIGGKQEVKEINGNYLLTVKSTDQDKLFNKLIGNQAISGLNTESLSSLKNYTTFEEVSFEVVINKQDFSLVSMKATIPTNIQVSAESMTETNSIIFDYKYSQYDESEGIVLPEGTENATDITDFYNSLIQSQS